jgi:hypothetical protein
MDFVSNIQDVTLLAETFAQEEQQVAVSHAARVEMETSLLSEHQQKVFAISYTQLYVSNADPQVIPAYDMDGVLRQLKEYAALYKALIESQTRANRHPDVPSSIVAVSSSPVRLRGPTGGATTTNASPTRVHTPSKTVSRREVAELLESDAQLIAGNIEIVRMKNDIAVLKRHLAAGGGGGGGGAVSGVTGSNTIRHLMEFTLDIPQLTSTVTNSPTSRLPAEPSSITKGKKAALKSSKPRVPIEGVLPVIPIVMSQHKKERKPRPILSDSFATVSLEVDEHNEEGMDETAQLTEGDDFAPPDLADIVQTSGVLMVGLTEDGSVSAGNSVINVDIRRTPNKTTRSGDSPINGSESSGLEHCMSPPKTAEMNLRKQLEPQPHQPSVPPTGKSRPSEPRKGPKIITTTKPSLAINSETLLEQRLMEGGSTASGGPTVSENLGPHAGMLAPTPPSQSANKRRNFAPHRVDNGQPSYLKETHTRQLAVDPLHNTRRMSASQGPVYLLSPTTNQVVTPSVAFQVSQNRAGEVWQTDFKKQSQLQTAPSQQHSRNFNQQQEELQEDDSFSDSREAADRYYQDYSSQQQPSGGPGAFSPPSGTSRSKGGGAGR